MMNILTERMDEDSVTVRFVTDIVNAEIKFTEESMRRTEELFEFARKNWKKGR